MIYFLQLKIKQYFMSFLCLFMNDLFIYYIENVKYKDSILSFELDYRNHITQRLNKRYYFVYKDKIMYVNHRWSTYSRLIKVSDKFISNFNGKFNDINDGGIYGVDKLLKEDSFSNENYDISLIKSEVERYLSNGFDMVRLPNYKCFVFDGYLYRYNRSNKSVMKRAYRFNGCHIELVTNQNNIDDSIIQDIKFTLDLLNDKIPLLKFYTYLNKEVGDTEFTNLIICSQLREDTTNGSREFPKSYVSEYVDSYVNEHNQQTFTRFYEYLSATDTKYYKETEL